MEFIGYYNTIPVGHMKINNKLPAESQLATRIDSIGKQNCKQVFHFVPVVVVVALLAFFSVNSNCA